MASEATQPNASAEETAASPPAAEPAVEYETDRPPQISPVSVPSDVEVKSPTASETDSNDVPNVSDLPPLLQPISPTDRPTFEGHPLITRQDFADFLNNENSAAQDKTWVKVCDSELIKAWKKKHESGLVIVRAFGIFKGHGLKAITDMLYDVEVNKKWSVFWEHQKVLPPVDEFNNVLYLKSKQLVIGVDRRSLVQFRSQAYVDDASVIVCRNGAHPTCGKEKDVIRARTLGLTGFVVRPLASAQAQEKHRLQNPQAPPPYADASAMKLSQEPPAPPADVPKKSLRMRVLFTGCLDPRGVVPVSIVNMLASKSGPKWQESLQKALDKYDP